MDIQNKYLIETTVLPVMTRYFGVGSKLKLDDFGKQLLLEELTTVAGSQEEAEVLLGVFQDQFEDWTEHLMFFIRLFKDPTKFGFSLQEVNNSIASLAFPIDESIGVSYSRHYGCVGHKHSLESIEEMFDNIYDEVHDGHVPFELLSFDDSDGSFKVPDLVGTIRERFEDLATKTTQCYLMDNAPGGGTVICQTFNRVFVRGDIAVLVIDRINYDPNKTTIRSEVKENNNVVAFKRK